MSLFDIYAGITGLMLKGEYTVGIYPSQKCLSRLLEALQCLSFFSVDILAQGKIQNSHSPFLFNVH